MANILDYIKWRGDLTFNQAPFNEIDNLILSRVSYLPFDDVIKKNNGMKLIEAYEIIRKIDTKNLRILQKEDLDLLDAISLCDRFRKLFLSNYINNIDAEEEKQFSAITIFLPDDTIYISYRGTDDSLVGFKEDFNMSFMELIPAQVDAALYLNKIGIKHNKKLRIGGHSKGGNLAVYAAAFCANDIKKNIIEIYNNDGPGFFKGVIESEEYKSIISRVHKYQPQSSIIGRLLNYKEECTIVKSTQKGLMQHDLYSWQVLGNKFEYEEELSKESEKTNQMVTKWLETVTPEQREKFIKNMFEILKVTEAKTIEDLTSNWFINARKVLKSYEEIDEESKKILYDTLWTLIKR